jgi:hypothetical protein
MATQDIGGLLFGQGGSGLEDYLSPAQLQQMQQQGMLSTAAALLSASGTRPAGQGIGFGQAIGGALQAGQQGYQQAQQGAIGNLLARQKLTEGALSQARLKAYMRAIGQDTGETPQTVPSQVGMPSAPMGNGVVTSPVMSGGATPTPSAAGGIFSGLSEQQRRLLPLMNPDAAVSEAFKASGEKYLQMTPDELQAMGIQPNAVVFKGPTGKPEIISRPDFQYIETPAGGKQLIDMNNPLGTVPPRTAKAAVASGAAPAPTAAPTYAGGMAPAMKPEQINSAAQDWDKNFRTPVESILSSYAITKDLAMTGQGGISDYGVLIKALKALDPGSAVMQGEADSARQMQSMADRMQGLVDRIGQGGIGAEQARLDLVNLARSSANVAIDAYNRQAVRKSELLGQYMPQAAVRSIFQPYVKPADLTSKAQMEKDIKAGTVAPVAGQQMWRQEGGKWVYK